MGGLGKTTLAKQVYDRVVTQFDCHAWITVSESYDKKELLRKVMDKFCQTTTMESNIPARNGGVDEEIQIISKVREQLKNKRYVIFFDDVWKIEFWSDIEHALLDNNMGGRIVITTRSLDVANFAKHQLESNPHLSSISRILSLSYDDLPYYIKNCYLYFGMYPEDYSIKCSRLIRQWVSEGFITSKKDKTLEEVAQQYLTELMNRSLVQVSQVNYCGKPKECRIHDLLRDMILRKMEDLRFGSHYFPSNGSSFSEKLDA
ncbi:hypothetical protein FNV43_RR00122 [Rhamnella rubrinervis]|uniref:NBS-type RGA protein n=1 Tax=Rhamnella rubrinervis TaxID=2594499 RepID=A0A8K0HNY7_9ROSA|nr:hypothetical protein FNV43_RR00122 [Rhamnella rubrinervis]